MWEEKNKVEILKEGEKIKIRRKDTSWKIIKEDKPTYTNSKEVMLHIITIVKSAVTQS